MKHHLLFLLLVVLLPLGCENAISTGGAIKDNADNIATGIEGIVCSPAVLDLGALDPILARTVNCTFKIENRSNTEIHNLTFLPACGCIQVERSPQSLKSGAIYHAKLHLSLPELPGPLRKKIVLDGGARGQINLSIIGNIIPNPKLAAFPTEIDFGDVRHQDVRSRRVQIIRHDRTPVQITGIHCDHESIKLKKVASDNRAVQQIEVLFDSALVSVGAISTEVTVTTNHPRSPTMRIPITATVSHRHKSALVESVLIQRLAPAKSVITELFQFGHDIIPLNHYYYRGSEALDVSIVKDDGRPMIAITRVAPSVCKTSGVIEGELVVILDRADGPEITIPIRVFSSALP
jgi:hypothetical protein